MSWKLDLVMWLGDKLAAGLDDYFKEMYKPQTQEEIFELLEDEHVDTPSDKEKVIAELIQAWSNEDLEDGEDELIDKVLDELGANQNPVEKIFELEDKSGRMYFWKVRDDMSDEMKRNLYEKLVSAYRENFGRDPRAAHVIENRFEKVKQLDRQELKELAGFMSDEIN